jgi:flagellar motor switch protein FliN/FliY
METQTPYFWIRKIAQEERIFDQIPLFGHSPPFDWAAFSSHISARFGVHQPLVFKPRTKSWTTPEEMKATLGDEPIVLPIQVGSLAGHAFWIMSKEGVVKLTSWMLNGKAKTRPLASDLLAEGFYRYLVLQVMDVTSQLEPLKNLPLLLSESSTLPSMSTFCIDIEIDFDKHSSWGRLAIEPDLQRSWAQYFSTSNDFLSTNLAKMTEVNIGIKVGSSLLSQQEWKKLKAGDFLLLDRESYDPRKKTGVAYVTLGNMSLFQVHIKHNKMELIDYAFIYEDEMNNNNLPNHTPADANSEELAASEEEAVALKKLPILVTVELARLHITLEKLMQLAPGNLIDLPVHPDQAVKLTVNGQVVGQAELVHLGETLGLRILSLG